ncbi:MAG TPA: class I SAM-dependent methyltransferase [Terriglobales bacterium]|nr:class I SAM-dependent methyltransferase [Terriglobales bacterium]
MKDQPRLGPTVRSWWNDVAARVGGLRASQQLLQKLWAFLLDSTPSRRQQRYGDVDYDWEYRVDTTSATVSWRDRLLGEFLSPYQPTEPTLFHEMMAALTIDFSAFTFIDLGSGKGRTLLMACDYPFRRVVGIEVLPSLHRIAGENIRRYQSPSRRCLPAESVCQDARFFEFPDEPTVLYLFNPLPESALAEVIRKLADSIRSHPRPVYVIYHNALLEDVLAHETELLKIGGTHQYAIYISRQSS